MFFMRKEWIAVALALQVTAPSFRTRTDIVAMAVTVVDDRGATIKDLPQIAFSVMEDGRARPIVHFAADHVRISLVVAVDASDSMAGLRFHFAHEAVARLLDRLEADDEVSVLAFNDHPFNVAPWTADRSAILAALERVQPLGTTALYDTVVVGIDALRTSRQRRQALVIISDGGDYREGDFAGRSGGFPRARLRSMPAIERIQTSEALVYAIGVDGPLPKGTPGGAYGLDAPALRALTDPSGGVTHVVRTDEAIVSAAEAIGDELRQQYLVGFEPANPGDGKFHKVQVAVSGCSKCKVRARAGYTASRTAPR
jgi:Ca-activated chloride channel family protein